MSKFGFYTDCHLTSHHIRTDNYKQSILNKIRSIYNYAQKNNFDFMTFGGDFFHTYKVIDIKILVDVCQILKKFNKPTYVLIGNHDIYGNSLNGFHDSSLNLLCTLLPDLFIPLLNTVQLDDIIIYGCNTFNDLNYTLQHIDKNEKFQLMLDHHMIYDKGINGTTVIHPKQLGQNNLDLILTGHVHMGYKLYKYGNTSYYNPGSLSRTSRDLKDMKVSMAIIQTNGKSFTIDNFYPEMIDGNLVFKQNIFSGIQKVTKLEEQQVRDVNSIQSFKHFQELKYSSSSIFELLGKIGKQNNINNDVLSYINRFKGNIE